MTFTNRIFLSRIKVPAVHLSCNDEESSYDGVFA